jgi:hypothetical protein
MVIIARDASKMAQTGGRAAQRREWLDPYFACRRPGKRGLKRLFTNKIETIQSVLRHFLEEITGTGLGKS